MVVKVVKVVKRLTTFKWYKQPLGACKVEWLHGCLLELTTFGNVKGCERLNGYMVILWDKQPLGVRRGCERLHGCWGVFFSVA